MDICAAAASNLAYLVEWSDEVSKGLESSTDQIENYLRLIFIFLIAVLILNIYNAASNSFLIYSKFTSKDKYRTNSAGSSIELNSHADLRTSPNGNGQISIAIHPDPLSRNSLSSESLKKLPRRTPQLTV